MTYTVQGLRNNIRNRLFDIFTWCDRQFSSDSWEYDIMGPVAVFRFDLIEDYCLFVLTWGEFF